MFVATTVSVAYWSWSVNDNYDGATGVICQVHYKDALLKLQSLPVLTSRANLQVNKHLSSFSGATLELFTLFFIPCFTASCLSSDFLSSESNNNLSASDKNIRIRTLETLYRDGTGVTAVLVCSIMDVQNYPQPDTFVSDLTAESRQAFLNCSGETSALRVVED